jgi:hypothetical protein
VVDSNLIVNSGEIKDTDELDFQSPSESVNTIFFDTCSSAIRAGSTIRLALVEYVLTPDGKPFGRKAKHAVNLIVSLEGFRNMMNFLNQVLEDQVEQAIPDEE